MTDKEKLEATRAEIERLMYAYNQEADIASAEDSIGELVATGKYNVCKHLLSLIDSKQEEPTSDDVEEAAKHYLYSNILYDDVYVGNPTEKDCIEMFKAGAKWRKGPLWKSAEKEMPKEGTRVLIESIGRNFYLCDVSGGNVLGSRGYIWNREIKRWLDINDLL